MSAERPPLTRTTLAAACFVIVAATVLSWLPRINGPIDTRWDGGAYLVLGTSLATGHGYRLQSEPGDFPSSVHAPVVPAIVAAHAWLLGSTDRVVIGRALRVTTMAFSVAYGLAIFFLLKTSIPWPWAVVAAVTGVSQPQFAYFTDQLYAETFFGLFTLLFFILQRYRASRTCFVLAGLLAALAYGARTVGIALLVAWVVDTVLRRDFRRLPLVIAMAALPVVAWNGWIKMVESSPAYQHPAYAYQTAPYVYFNVSYVRNILTFKDPFDPRQGPLTRAAFIDRVATNVRELPTAIGEAVSAWEAPAALSTSLGILVLAGLAMQLARRQWLIVLYVALSLAAMVVTPFRAQFVRYVLPLYPFFVLAMFQAIAQAARALRNRWPVLPAALGPAATALVVGSIALSEAFDVRELYAYHDVAYEQSSTSGKDRLYYYAPLGTDFDEALVWLRGDGHAPGVVAATDPQRAFLLTGRKAVLPPFESDGARAQVLIDSVPVRYLIAETKPAELGLGKYHPYTAAMVRANPRCWTLLWTSAHQHVVIYERSSVAECGGPSAAHSFALTAR